MKFNYWTLKSKKMLENKTEMKRKTPAGACLVNRHNFKTDVAVSTLLSDMFSVLFCCFCKSEISCLTTQLRDSRPKQI